MNTIQYLTLVQREVSKARIVCGVELEEAKGLRYAMAICKALSAMHAEANCILLNESLDSLKTIIELLIQFEGVEEEQKEVLSMAAGLLKQRPIQVRKPLKAYIKGISQYSGYISSASYIMPNSLKRIYGFDMLATTSLERSELIRDSDKFLATIEELAAIDFNQIKSVKKCLALL